MKHEKINTTEVQILKRILYEKQTISQIAVKIQKSLSYTSECVSHLANLEFIHIDKRGMSSFVTISHNPLGESLSLLMTENSHLNLNHILADSGLLVLPLILYPGMHIKDIAERSNRSTRTIRDLLNRWKGMGIIIQMKDTQEYILNSKQRYLIQFVTTYSKYHNRRMLREIYSDALIVWQKRDEFIFSLPYHIDHHDFIPAASSRLQELEYDVISISHYYYYNPQYESVSEEEALVQTIKLHPENPRPLRFLREAINKERVQIDSFQSLIEKYEINSNITQGVE